MHLKIDKKIILVVTGVAGVVFLGIVGYLLVMPLVQELASVREQKNLYSDESRIARELLLTRKVQGVMGQLVSKDKVPEVMKALSRTAMKFDIQLVALRPSGLLNEEGDIYRTVRLDAEAFTSLKNLGLFLSAVRDMPDGIIDVEDLRVWPDDKDPARITAKFTFILFVAK
jgi:hypothetical protein